MERALDSRFSRYDLHVSGAVGLFTGWSGEPAALVLQPGSPGCPACGSTQWNRSGLSTGASRIARCTRARLAPSNLLALVAAAVRLHEPGCGVHAAVVRLDLHPR
jgi:hypothetical protein